MSRVGHFLGRLFSGHGDRETLLRAYGKLPFYAEYRRLELAPGTATAFSQWLDAGRLAWARATSPGGGGAVRPSRLLLRLPETREAVVASVWDSRDSLGRTFPFVFFVVCPPGTLGDNPLESWVATFAIQATFDRCYRELAVLGRGGNFYRLYHKRPVALRPDDLAQRAKRLRHEAGTITAEEWFQSALNGVDPQAWYAGLLYRARRWRSQAALAAELAISVPLARGYSAEVQVVLWLSWFSGFIAKAGKSASVVFPAERDADRPALHLLARDPLPDDFQLLTTAAGEYGYVEDLAQVPKVESLKSDAAANVPPSGPLLDWLSKHAP